MATTLVQAPEPTYRRLRVYAFDPSLTNQVATSGIGEIILKVPWETPLGPDKLHGDGTKGLSKGPVGEYLEVIDYDPASGCFYPPVYLDDPNLLAQDGLAPSEGNPQFHQQMVYAVGMTTIRNFERALGRVALWAPHRPVDANGKYGSDQFVRRLRLYPHALRQANAYYSPQKKAILFGYFPADASDAGEHMPGGQVFTCLSYDIIVHETTHALLDGLHRRFTESSNPDVLAFHEAFADLVALFQHFSSPEVLVHQIARTRGDLSAQSLLGELAQQFGRSTGGRGALRDAIGGVGDDDIWRPAKPDPQAMTRETEPHKRGSLLVAAVFGAFLTIYRERVVDLLRIAGLGGDFPSAGSLHPDLVKRLAGEASKSASHLLNVCIRALDYLPPVDVTFGEYLRALITADSDLVPEDPHRYRVAIIESFRRWGIYPRDLRTLSQDSLRWESPCWEHQAILDAVLPDSLALQELLPTWNLQCPREKIFYQLHGLQARFKQQLQERLNKTPEGYALLGLSPDVAQGSFEVHSVRPTQRIGPSGQTVVDLVVELTQRRPVEFRNGEIYAPLKYGSDNAKQAAFWFRGGATLLIDPFRKERRTRYVIRKNIASDRRLNAQAQFHRELAGSLRSTYFTSPHDSERFAILHDDLTETPEKAEEMKEVAHV